jgi:hypothetical protein
MIRFDAGEPDVIFPFQFIGDRALEPVLAEHVINPVTIPLMVKVFGSHLDGEHDDAIALGHAHLYPS